MFSQAQTVPISMQKPKNGILNSALKRYLETPAISFRKETRAVSALDVSNLSERKIPAKTSSQVWSRMSYEYQQAKRLTM